jgi:hypothetical protein
MNGLGGFLASRCRLLRNFGDLLDVGADFFAGARLLGSSGSNQPDHVAHEFGIFDDFVETVASVHFESALDYVESIFVVRVKIAVVRCGAAIRS